MLIKPRLSFHFSGNTILQVSTAHAKATVIHHEASLMCSFVSKHRYQMSTAVKGCVMYILYSCIATAKPRSVTCHMKSHSVTSHLTQVNVPHLNPQPDRQVLDLPTAEEWKAELALVLVTHQNGLSVHSLTATKVEPKTSQS